MYMHKGVPTRSPSRYSGYVLWCVPDGAEFDVVDTEGYNPHAKIVDVENRFTKFNEFLTDIDDLPYTMSTYYPEEYEDEFESFIGAPPVRPVVRKVYGFDETERHTDWDPVEMYRRLEGKEPSAKAPAPEPPVPMCRAGKHVKTYKGSCAQCEAERKARVKAAAEEARAHRPRVPELCGLCRQPGHRIQTCPEQYCEFCAEKGHSKKKCPKRLKLLGLTPRDPRPQTDPTKPRRGRKPGQPGICSGCGQTGHNIRTCPTQRTSRRAS